jgi:hypothetical protein
MGESHLKTPITENTKEISTWIQKGVEIHRRFVM